MKGLRRPRKAECRKSDFVDERSRCSFLESKRLAKRIMVDVIEA